MSAFRASRSWPALTLALLVSATGWAQGGSPVQIVPSEEGRRAPSQEGPGGIRIETLPEPSFEAAGTLEPAEGGLGRDMWAGTTRDIVTANLGQLPAEPASAAIRDIQRRLLLTPANVPAGLAVGHDVLTLRVDRLRAMGALDGLIEVLDVVPPGERTARYARAEVEARLAAGQVDKACTAAQRHVGRYDDAIFGRVLVVCHVIGGENDMAAFALGLLREEGGVDQRYLNLLAALRGDASVEIETLPNPSPLELVMLHGADRRLPANDLDGLSPLAVRAVLRAGRQPPLEAVGLSERAITEGLISYWRHEAAMRAAAETVKPYSPERIGALSAEAVQDYARDGVELRVRVYAGAIARADPGNRVRVLAEAWRWIDENFPRDRLMSYATAGPLAEIAPAPEHAEIGRNAARTMYEAGRRSGGDRWYRLLDDLAAVGDLSVLWPLAHLSDPAVAPWDNGRLHAWYELASGRGEVAATRQAEILFAAVDGLEGDALARGDWRGVLDRRRAETIAATIPRTWRHARSAAFDGRRGEAVLLALNAAGARNIADFEPAEVRALVYVLAASGLESEARAVAIEAFLAAGG